MIDNACDVRFNNPPYTALEILQSLTLVPVFIIDIDFQLIFLVYISFIFIWLMFYSLQLIQQQRN